MPETVFHRRWVRPAMALDVSPVLVGIVAIILGFVFFVYLFLRRIATGFKQGLEQSRK